MLTLSALAALAAAHADELDQPVAPLRIGAKEYDTDTSPVIRLATSQRDRVR